MVPERLPFMSCQESSDGNVWPMASPESLLFLIPDEKNEIRVTRSGVTTEEPVFGCFIKIHGQFDMNQRRFSVLR